MRVGERYQNEYTCDPDVFDGFLKAFNDRNPIHVDDEYAQKNGFHAKVMHGNILNGFCSHFIGECLPKKKVMIISQEIRFRNPFFLGDHLLFTAEVVSSSESVKLVEFKFQFRRFADEKKIANGRITVLTRE